MAEYEYLTELLVEFYDKISAWEQEKVRGAALTVQQMHILEILGHHQEPMRMMDLAAKMGVTSGTLSVGVDRLEKQGVVQRSPHASDRRSVVVALTDAGQGLFAEHHGYHLALTRVLCERLTDEEQAALQHILERLNAAQLS